jgi:hypothetical protein
MSKEIFSRGNQSAKHYNKLIATSQECWSIRAMKIIPTWPWLALIQIS